MDDSVKTGDRAAVNAVMKFLKKVLLGIIVGCLVGTLFAAGGIAILIACLMSSNSGGGAPIGAAFVAFGIFVLCLIVGGIWGVISAVKGLARIVNVYLYRWSSCLVRLDSFCFKNRKLVGIRLCVWLLPFMPRCWSSS